MAGDATAVAVDAADKADEVMDEAEEGPAIAGDHAAATADAAAQAELTTVGADEHVGTWASRTHGCRWGFCAFQINRGVLLPALHLGTGEGDDVDIAKFDGSINNMMRERGVLLDSAGERRFRFSNIGPPLSTCVVAGGRAI